MAASSTSFRISTEAKQRLADRAEREGLSATALLGRLILEGVAALEHPGIVFRDGPSGRRAALAGGPDVWEIVARLRELDGSEDKRVATLADEIGLHERQIGIALTYAADHPDEVERSIADNERALEEAERAHAARARLLDSA